MSTGRKTLAIVAGVVLIGIALAWLVVRNQDAVQVVFGMDHVWGWAAHFTGVLVLLGGTALIARGIVGHGGRTPGHED